MKKTHKAKALAISCIDFRFVTKIRDFLMDQGLNNNYDLITVPGASLSLPNITQSILTSIRLHEPDKIYIFDHEDCGAYKEDNSKKVHSRNLLKAKEILLNDYSKIQVNTYFVDQEKVEEIA